MLATTLFTLLSVASPHEPGPTVAAGREDPRLSVRLESASVVFTITGPKQRFLGGVLLSLSADLEQRRPDLPFTLVDSVLYGVGVGSAEGHSIGIAESLLPPGIVIYAQGLLMVDGVIAATGLDGFVLDASGKPQLKPLYDDATQKPMQDDATKRQAQDDATKQRPQVDATQKPLRDDAA